MGDAAKLSEFPFAQVADWLSAGNVIPFVGAGASRSDLAGDSLLPDGSALAGELAKKMPAYVDRGSEGLAKVAQVFEQIVFDRDALYEYLHRRFEAEQSSREPSGVARFLADIPHDEKPLFVITTNYDTFIERAFRAANKPICVITQNMRDPEHGATGVSLILPDGQASQEESKDFQWQDEDRFPRECTFLFKMHGSVRQRSPKPPDDVIITEDDYIDFMVNAGGLVNAFFPPPSLTWAYKDRRFLFLGYSLYDWNFRAFLRFLALRNALSNREQKRHFAIQIRPDSLEVDLWRSRNVNVFDGDLDDFCRQMATEFSESDP